MSYLSPPRLHFAGKFEAAVSTVNNDVVHFDNALFRPEWQELQGTGNNLNGWFNPRGDAAFRLIGCQITGAYGPDGQPVGSDPVFGCVVADSDRRPPAKLVDLDPEQQLVSEIHGLEVRICDVDGKNLVRGTYETAAFMDIWDRAAGAGSDTNAGSMYQSVLFDLEWGDVSGSPFLTDLRAAAEDGLLSIKFNVDGFNMDYGGPDFMRGRIVGTIGPASAAEPRHLVLGRHLLASANPNGNFFLPNRGINFCAAVVDQAAGIVRVDLGNAIPTVDPGGDILTPGAFGRIALAYLDPAPTQLGLIAYGDPGWYQSTAGIVDVPVTAAQLAAIEDRPLALLRRVRSAGPPPSAAWQVAVQEAGSGLHVRADTFVFRLDPGETASVRAYATRFGQGHSGQVNAALDDGGIQSQVGLPPGDPAGAVAPPVATPVGQFPSALDFPEHVSADAAGVATLAITARDPGNPRRYVDGQLYGLRLEVDGAPAGDPAPDPWEFISFLVFDGFTPDEPLTWHGSEDGSLQPIFQQYANLYPVMYTFLNLADYDDVCRNRDMLLLAFRLADEDPNQMPVTRDLSGAKRRAVIRWLETLGPDGKPALGRLPAEAPTRLVVADAEAPEPTTVSPDLARKGGKAAAIARRNRPVAEPPPGSPA